MQKDFDTWNENKKKINGLETTPFCHAREIWWCSLGVNIGFEQDSGENGRRPVLILKSISFSTCLVIPLTTSNKKHPLRPSIGVVDGKEARVLISQIRVVDTKRFGERIGYLARPHFERVQKTAREFFF